MPITIPWYKKLWSYCFAVLIQKVHSQYSPEVELVLFHNQLMLTTPQAMYSYGVKYAPFNLAFAALYKQKQLHPTNILLLGGALLSAAQILHYTYKMHPAITVVEIDGKYQKIIYDYLPSLITDNITYHHQDAKEYIANCTTQYDMIAIDIFIELVVPAFCLHPSFLQQCHQCVTANGIVIMNTHFKIANEKMVFENTFASIFKNHTIIPHGNNYIFIGEK
jgi:spermidine synthase